MRILIGSVEPFQRQAAGHVILDHLSGPGAGARQALAAHYLRGFAHIVEIGGAGLPIDGFLTHRPASVTIIDPKITPHEADTLNGAPCKVRHLRAKVQQAHLGLEPRGYGLVLLGLSLRAWGDAPGLGPHLLDLVDNAGLVVIDHSSALERCAPQAAAIVARPGLRLDLTIDLDLDDAAIRQTPFGKRRFHVLRARS